MHSLFALPAILLALTPFHSTAKPLPPPVQKQLKAGGFWHRGCPVPLSGLRLLTVSHRGFDGRTHTGQLIVNKRAARPLARVFRKLYGLHFPIRHMDLADFYGPRRDRPDDVTASFECRQAVPSPAQVGAARAPGRSTPTAWRWTSTRAKTPTSDAGRAATGRRGATATAPATARGW